MTTLAHRLLKLTLCIAFAVALAGTGLGDAVVRAAEAPAKPAVGYCYYAQIYGRSPVGLPVPPALKCLPDEEVTGKLNRLLQEIAWNAVTQHPLSGVKAK